MKLGGKNNHESRIHDFWNGSALFGVFGGGVNSEKLEKMRYQTVRGNEL